MSLNSKKRIAMISTHGYVSASPEFGKPDTGGQVVFVLELSKCLARMGFQVDILTRRFEDQPACETVCDGVEVRRYACGGEQFIPKETLYQQIPEWAACVRDDVQAREIQYTFINSHYWDAGIAGQALSEELNISHFHTPHSIGAWKRENMDGDPGQLEARYNFRCRIDHEAEIYHKCDLLIATTPQQRSILVDQEYHVSDEKIRVLPPGYDDQRFFPVDLETRRELKQKLDVEGPIVLALGRMAHNKGYDLLIRAMPTVCKRVPAARLLLAVGSNNPPPKEVKQVEQLKRLACELSIPDRVLFRSHIADDLLPDYYRAANVFALSSRYEPFGMTAIEAMACGTPTVITTEGGLWEEVQWGVEAIYANPFDAEAYGHALTSVLMYPQVAAQLSKHGEEKARACFTWNGVARQLLDVLADGRREYDFGFSGNGKDLQIGELVKGYL